MRETLAEMNKVVEEGVGSVAHHEVGGGSESGFQEFRQISVPNGL